MTLSVTLMVQGQRWNALFCIILNFIWWGRNRARNHNDESLCGFQNNKGESSVIYAEVSAILLGLKLAWAKGFNSVRVDSDSMW